MHINRFILFNNKIQIYKSKRYIYHVENANPRKKEISSASVMAIRADRESDTAGTRISQRKRKKSDNMSGMKGISQIRLYRTSRNRDTKVGRARNPAGLNKEAT